MEAIKGGASSALKRAAAVWGIGRYLYYLPVVWVKTKVLYTKKNGDPVYGFAEQPQLSGHFLPNHNIERWEDVLELELTKQTELEDDTLTVEDRKAQLKKKLEV